MKEITRVERGWTAHFICGHRCQFRRNTLITQERKRIVISTIGMLRDNGNGKIETVGNNRYYETMAFKARYEAPYWEANTSKQVSFESKWSLNEKVFKSDMVANEMHETVVNELIKKWGE